MSNENNQAVATREMGGLEAISVGEVERQIQVIQDLMRRVMKEGQDGHYGKVPGCGDKPALLKAGAEKLSFVFRLSPEFEIQEKELTGGHREYRVICTMRAINSGRAVGQGVGVCSTMEAKYRFRNAVEFTGKAVPQSYWNIKKNDPDKAMQLLGGKGYGTKKNDQGYWEIVKTSGDKKTEHDNPADYFNTVLKMAKKRAHVDAILTATAASDIFTQDVEEMAENGTAPKSEPKKETEPRQESRTDGHSETRNTRSDPEPESSSDPANWREFKMHFGKHDGKRLGELEHSSLAWFVQNWHPKPWPEGTNQYKFQDKMLRKALDAAKAELGSQEQESQSERDEVPA